MLTDVIIVRTQAILQGISGVANVHPFIRIAADDAAFKNLFFDAAMGRIHGYTITRESTKSMDNKVGAREDWHTIVIRGYMSAHDPGVPDPQLPQPETASETLMQTEIETIRATFAGKRHLEDAQNTRYVFWCDPMQCRSCNFAMFSGVLCHYAELTIVVKDYPLNP